MRVVTVLPLLLIAALALPAAADTPAPTLSESDTAPITFRYRFTPAETLAYEDRVVQTANTGSSAIETTLSSLQLVETLQVAPGGGRARLSSRRTKVAIAIREGDAGIPTKKLEPVVKALEKVRVTVDVSPRGEQSHLAVEHVSVQVQQLLDSFGQAMVGATPIFPEAALALGESWRQSVPMSVRQGPARVELHFDIAYTYRGRRVHGGRELAVIGARTTLKVPASSVSLGESTMKVSGSGSGEGTLLFDLKKGRIAQADLSSNQTLMLEVIGPDAPPRLTIRLASRATRKAVAPSPDKR